MRQWLSAWPNSPEGVRNFRPQSLLDAGSGPGTAAWAATAAYPDISTVTFLDNNVPFLKLASSLAAQSDHPALRQARALNADISNLPAEASADLVVAAYALAELPLSQSERDRSCPLEGLRKYTSHH